MTPLTVDTALLDAMNDGDVLCDALPVLELVAVGHTLMVELSDGSAVEEEAPEGVADDDADAVYELVTLLEREFEGVAEREGGAEVVAVTD